MRIGAKLIGAKSIGAKSIGAKLTVAGAAGLFGVVIAAGGAFAASGSALVPDAPGTVLQVQGVGTTTAAPLDVHARLELLANARLGGTIQTVFPAAAIALGASAADESEQAATQQTVPDEGSGQSVVGEDGTDHGVHEAGTGNKGIAGNGNTNNGKGNDGVSGNGNTSNGYGNAGNNGKSDVNPGNNGQSENNGNPGNNGNNGNNGKGQGK